MINSNTSFGTLKEVIVGRELNITKRIMDLTFKFFYKENLKLEIYEKTDIDSYKINYELLQKRILDLDNLAKVLESFNIKVYRPKELTKIILFLTPTFKSEVSSASNVRDISLVYNNKIIETPVSIRNRYFENMALFEIFNKCFDNGNGGLWIKAPNTKLTEYSIDLDDWKNKRDYININSRFEMAIDGAQFLRIGKDVIVNISTYNHYLGYQWIKSFFPDSNFHVVHLTDNHIDGVLVCLKPGIFLINPLYVNEIQLQLPAKFKNWKFLIPDNTLTIDTTNMTDIDICLASSRGIDINVLSINENTVLVNKRAISVIKLLEQNKFNVIPIELENCEIFAGGIHCSTLDLVRDDEYIDYCN